MLLYVLNLLDNMEVEQWVYWWVILQNFIQIIYIDNVFEYYVGALFIFFSFHNCLDYILNTPEKVELLMKLIRAFM